MIPNPEENLWGCPQPTIRSFQFIIGALRRNYVHSVEWRGGITEIGEGLKHKVWTNNAPLLKKSVTHVGIQKWPHLRTLEPFYKPNMSISPTKMKEKWTNRALKMPWGSMYAAIMPLWRNNKGHLMGASCGHKDRHRPESKFYQCFYSWWKYRSLN